MKIFNHEFWGAVMIWLGALIIAGVVYDSIRPYFPARSPSTYRQSFRNFIQKGLRFRFPPLRDKPPGLKPPSIQRPPEPLPPPPRRPPPPPFIRTASSPPPAEERLLTSTVHQTQGHYHLWVWGVKPEYKTGNSVRVEIAHATAGEKGKFWIVAYADTDGNGRPDKEIAKSNLLVAQKPGQWSSLEFESAADRIFVGNTWQPGTNAWVFRGNGPWPQANSPFEDRFYHAISPQDARPAGPAYTNMHISFTDR